MSLSNGKTSSFFASGVTNMNDFSYLVNSDDEEDEIEEVKEEPQKDEPPQASPAVLDDEPENSQDPEAHLEALDTILNCAALQRCGEDASEISALLRQARSLLLDNTVAVILHSMRHLHADSTKLPTFWARVRCPREVATWLGLFDVILYCWGGRQDVGDVTAFVERHVRGFTEQLRHLRALYDFPEDDLQDSGAATAETVRRHLDDVKGALKPAHWGLVGPIKKLRPSLQPLWRILTAVLRLCNLMESSVDPSGPLVTVVVMKETLKNLTFAHLDRLADFETLAVDPETWSLLRSPWLRSPEFDPSAIAACDVSGLSPTWAAIPKIAGDFVAYLRAVEVLGRLRERLALQQVATLKEEVRERLLTLGAGQLDILQRHQEWRLLPEPAKVALEARRADMAARCTVTSGSEASSPSCGPPTAIKAFEVGLDVPKSINWRLSNVKSPMTDYL